MKVKGGCWRLTIRTGGKGPRMILERWRESLEGGSESPAERGKRK